MKIFILILCLNGTGKSIAMHEFNSLQSCQSAGREFVSKFSGWAGEPLYICTEK